MKGISYLLWLIFFISFGINGQSIENNKSIPDGNTGTIIITYDLVYLDVTQKFTIAFFSSHDNYTKPLRFVTGDVGDNVMPGRMKRASWDAMRELPSNFDGDVQIRIRATKILEPVINLEPLALKTYKTGNTISLIWTGGSPSDKITVRLNQDQSSRLTISEEIDNSGSFTWKVPKKLKGKNYSVILINSSRGTEPVSSTEFSIKPRIPILAIALPIVAAGVAVGILSGGDGNPPTDEVLPRPLNPASN